jgi:hypothetical protein
LRDRHLVYLFLIWEGPDEGSFLVCKLGSRGIKNNWQDKSRGQENGLVYIISKIIVGNNLPKAIIPGTCK